MIPIGEGANYGIPDVEKYLMSTEFEKKDKKIYLVKHHLDPETGEYYKKIEPISNEQAIANGCVSEESLSKKKPYSVVKW
ncbi:MAG: hypothetical protein GXN99_02175 [Candidatus Nanohaloarchaeota archaeon]|nr:hypothetical protein [Candidatus Nanohaloarchaeota archaeon]